LLHPLVPPLSLDDHQIRDLQRLVQDLPRAWRHPKVPPDLRKAVARAVIRAVYLTPHPDVWKVQVEWANGLRTTHELHTTREIHSLVRRDYQEGFTPAEIGERLIARGVVRPRGPHVGLPYDEHAVHLLLQGMKLPRPFRTEVYARIRARFNEGIPLRAIADELNAQGTRHPLGEWTLSRVRRLVLRLRDGAVPGVEPLLQISPLAEPVRALHSAGLLPREIAQRLTEQGIQTRRRGRVTPACVLDILRSLGLRSNAVTTSVRLLELLAEWSKTLTVPEITARVKALGFRTQRGRPWTQWNMYKKLQSVGLQASQKRTQRERPSDTDTHALPLGDQTDPKDRPT
jgi:hypothetical protein